VNWTGRHASCLVLAPGSLAKQRSQRSGRTRELKPLPEIFKHDVPNQRRARGNKKILIRKDIVQSECKTFPGSIA